MAEETIWGKIQKADEYLANNPIWTDQIIANMVQLMDADNVMDAIDWAEEKLLHRKSRRNFDKWLKKEGYPVPKGALAKFGSKLLGPLQYMLPGTLHSGELTHAQRRDTHHPNTNIWGYTGD